MHQEDKLTSILPTFFHDGPKNLVSWERYTSVSDAIMQHWYRFARCFRYLSMLKFFVNHFYNVNKEHVLRMIIVTLFVSTVCKFRYPSLIPKDVPNVLDKALMLEMAGDLDLKLQVVHCSQHLPPLMELHLSHLCSFRHQKLQLLFAWSYNATMSYQTIGYNIMFQTNKRCKVLSKQESFHGN